MAAHEDSGAKAARGHTGHGGAGGDGMGGQQGSFPSAMAAHSRTGDGHCGKERGQHTMVGCFSPGVKEAPGNMAGDGQVAEEGSGAMAADEAHFCPIAGLGRRIGSILGAKAARRDSCAMAAHGHHGQSDAHTEQVMGDQDVHQASNLQPLGTEASPQSEAAMCGMAECGRVAY